MAGINRVVVELVAQYKEFKAGMAESQKSLVEFGAEAESMSAKTSHAFSKMGSVIAIGAVGAVAYGVKEAYKFNEALDAIRNQSNASAAEIDYLKGKIIDVSNATGYSAEALAGAALQIEKAGIKGKAAYDLLNNAAEGARITGGDVTAMTQSIIAAQTLQVAKGQSVAKITATIVQAEKMHLGSLNSLLGLLKGPVGARLAAYGVSLSEAAAVTDIASKAGLTNARALNQMVMALHKLDNPTKSQAASLDSLGIKSSALTSMLKKPDGLIQVFEYLRQKADASHTSVTKFANAVFGASGGATATVLINNVGDLTKAYKQLGDANPTALQAQFQETMTQLGPMLQKAGANLTNALLNVGELILPKVATVASWVASFAGEINKNATLRYILAGVGFAAVVGKVIQKAASVFQAVKGFFTGGEQAANTVATDANTAALEANTIALGGEAVGSTVGGIGSTVLRGAGAAGSVLSFAALPAAAALGLYFAANSGPKTSPKYLPQVGTDVGGGGRGRADLIHPGDWRAGQTSHTVTVRVK